MIFRVKSIALAALCCALTTGLRAWADLAARDAINLNISNDTGYQMSGDGTTVTLAGEMPDNAWQNTPSGNAVVSGDARNGRVTGVVAYDGTAKEATTLPNVTFTWAVEGSGTANYGNLAIDNNPTFHKAWLARASGASETSSILVQCIPYRKYDIIVYCFGSDDSAFNPVYVNGVPYVGDTSLSTDTNTRKAASSSETWGGRLASPSLGQTAIRLNGLENPELSLTVSSGATSICAVQILRDMSEGVWPTSKKVISLNLTSAYLDAGTTPAVYGLEPVPDEAWTKDGFSSITSSGADVTATIKEWSGSSAVDATSVTVNEKAANAYGWMGYNYSPANKILSGYLDDGGARATVTVANIPYAVYDVIVYCATDTEGRYFGPVKVNGTPYRWDEENETTTLADSADSTASTCWGWSRSRVPAYGRNAIRIANQSGSTLTVVGANNANNARGGIAAIQIVEAYAGTAVYANGAWTTDPTAGNDAIIVVDGDTTLAYSKTTEKLGKVSVVGSGTLTVSGSTISATTLDIDSSVSVTMNSFVAPDTVTGSGTAVYDGVVPPTGKGWTDSAWQGTVWIKNKSGITGNNNATTGVRPNSLGSINSKVKFSGVSGWLEAPIEYNPEIVLENDTYDYALQLTDGNSPNTTNPDRATIIRKLSGSGTLSCGGTSYAVPTLKVYDASGFTGSINAVNADDADRTGLVVLFCDEDTDFSGTLVDVFINAGLKRTIYIASGKVFTIPNTATWTAPTGIKVDGELCASSFGRLGDGTTVTTTDNGVFTLVTTENTDDVNTDYSRIQGTGTLKLEGEHYRTISTNNFPTTMVVENNLVAGGFLHKLNGVQITIGSLSGTGRIRSDWNSGNRDLKVLQARDTTFSGLFDSSYDRIGKFVVAPGASSAGTLTLAGAQTASNELVVDADAAVNLTGTWVGATTVSGTFGGTGTLNGDLTFNGGSKFRVFALDEDVVNPGLSVSGTIAYPASGTVKVEVNSGVAKEDVYYIPLLSGVDSDKMDKFELDESLQSDFGFVLNGDVLGLERKSDYLATYQDYVTFTLNDIGTTPIANYTLLVRISESLLPGFSYTRAGDGSEIAFTDGHGAPLSYEIDTWNTKGESLVWVKVPEAVNGTQVVFYWALNDGKSAPSNDPTKVWSDYAGVWHMDDAHDSTVNNATGVMGPSASATEKGLFGGAIGATVTGVNGALVTVETNAAINALADSGFTVSGWVCLNTLDADWAYLFTKKLVDDTDAWGLQFYGDGNGKAHKSRLWVGGSGYFTKNTPFVAGQWHYITLVFGRDGGSTIAWYMDGSAVQTTYSTAWSHGTDGFSIGGLPTGHGTLNGKMDEVRLRKGTVSTVQMQAEYANVQQTDYLNAFEGDGTSFMVPSAVVSDGVVHDYWLHQPTISPNYWNNDPLSAVGAYTEGVLRSGAAVTNWCENLLTHEVVLGAISSEALRSLPVGSYRIHCARKNTENAEIAGETTVDFTVVKNSGTGSVGETASGRILLMNNDSSHDETIDGQGYSNTNKSEAVYWEFLGEDELSSTMNILPSTNSILWTVDGTVSNKLWHLVSSRHGNTFPRNDSDDLVVEQNYLPWSTEAYSVTNDTLKATSRADAGQILMQNSTEAAVYSPCYTEGIGTIYFDAVNGWTNNLAAYKLIVEYATNTLTGAQVFDENLWLKDDNGTVTNWYGNLDDDCWQACEVNLARVTGGSTIDNTSKVDGEFSLDVVSDSPSTGEFYRVYAKLDIREPVRFRIRRTASDGTSGDPAYILLDNIIVSYPGMGATLGYAGWYDETKKGSTVLGFESAFTKPFPVAGDEEIHGKAAVEYYINPSQAPAETNFFASAKMFYRWRYLAKESEWKSVALDPDNDFRSVEPLDLPDEVGDVEFWYEYVLQAPYYSYVDYTGLPGLGSAFSATYTEAIVGPQTNRANVVLNDYPTLGTDWFVRLRRNDSAYEGIKLYAKSADGSVNHTIDMTLVGKGTWRGFVPTLTALEDGLQYRMEGLNPQTDDNWQWSTNYFSATSTGVEEVVASLYMVGESDTNNWKWATVECDAATGHLMFQFDENTLSLTIAHADYQNINKWHDAHPGDGSFVGSSMANDSKKKSGTSGKTRDFSEDYDSWPDTPATKSGLWEEAFELSGDTSVKTFGGKGLYEPFDDMETPNQWKSGPGMWVYSQHYNPNASDHWALQMKGLGSGYLMFTGNEADTPYGIGSVSYKARLAQEISFDTMSYDDNASRGLTNYTFFSFASVTDNPTTDTFDGDASVSVIAYYTPQNGCYEFRATQNDSSSLMLSIYRWNKTGAPTGKATLLAQQKFTNAGSSLKMTGSNYSGLFISCSNEVSATYIVVGIMHEPQNDGALRNATTQLGDVKWLGLACRDTDESRLTAGRYGLTSKNCPAIFWNPRHCEKELTLTFEPGGTVSEGAASYKKYYDAGTSGSKNTFKIDAGGASPKADAVNSLSTGNWAIDANRFSVTNISSSVHWGLAARTIPQKVAVEWAPAGKSTGFTGVVTNEVVSYKMSNYTVPVYLREDASLRLKMVGSDQDARSDVVIDNVSFTQFRGGTMGGRDADYAADDGYGFRTNFYFSSCWMTNGMAKMSARRTPSDGLCAIRSPLMDGIDGRGIGLGMFAFEYRNAQTNTMVVLQIATNVTESSIRSYNDPKRSSLWVDVTNFTFTAETEDLEHGMRSCYLGLHDEKGMMRIVVTNMAEVASVTDPTAFGEIDIEKVFCRDEPALDEASWWGWNVRSLNWDESSAYDDGSRTILHDYMADPNGMSIALNNSVTEDTQRIDGEVDESFKSSMPFVQTPTFASDIVGEVSFVARRFDNEDEAQYAEVALYGAKSGNASTWEPLKRFIVSNTVYQTYSCQMPANSNYSAFRLAVTGVDGIDDPDARGDSPTCGTSPVRVMIDEIAVFEAVKPTMGFRYVYPFRTDLDLITKNTNVVDAAYKPQPDEQPLSGESWTVQAEIFAKQLPDQIDLSKTPKVLFHWFVGGGVANWGWEQWQDRKSGTAELALADGETLVFRGSVPLAPSAIVEPNESAPAIVQYITEVVYTTTSDEVLTNTLQKSEWVIPPWYSPVDYNVRFAGRGWSAFTILDTISPKRAWINEVNIFDGKEGSDYPGYTNQYVEVAVPQRQPIDGWSLQYIDYNMTTNTLCTFGSDGIAATKTLNETNGYVFVTVQSPHTAVNGSLSSIAGEVDGMWADFDGYGGKLDQTHAMALKLVRKSGVVEQEIVLVGTNRWVGTAREEVYSHDTFIGKLEADGHTGVYYVGDEFSSTLDTSLGVTNGIGEIKAYWTSPMKQTPGRANVNQAVPEDYVILANGTMLRVFSSIGELGKGHVRQTFGTLVDSTEDTYVMTFKGEGGTNIVYTIDQWWEIASLTTNNVEVSLTQAEREGPIYLLENVGAHQSNDVTVVVSAQPRKDLREDYGLTEDNKYTSAVLDWLANGETLNGPFANPGKLEDSYFGSVHDLSSTIRPLTLTERYWLDIDPTTNWVFRAGIVKAPTPVTAYAAVDPDKVPTYDTVDNLRITIKMFITNETGAVYAPYVLRGFEPGSVSTNYSFASDYTWTSVTFKVTGDLQNGLPMRKRWVPLRRFIFAPGSFDSNYEAEIEVWDPFDDGSIWTPGWSDFKGYPVFYSWSIDDRGGPDTVEVLEPKSIFKTSTP